MRTTLRTRLQDLFFTPVRNGRQITILVLVAFLLIFFSQLPPVDWDLNTKGFWSDLPNTYADPNRVNPPWGLILMIPYYLMGAEGARFLSGIVIGLLVIRRGRSLSQFFAIVLSPYFLWTLETSNMDILVLVLPILLWEMSWGKRWQSIGRGCALSISLLKPQGMLLIWLYWFWSCRKQWKELIVPVTLAAGVVIPISLVGSPPLVVQWLNNLANPSPENKLYWTVNNVSLTAQYSLSGALLILVPLALVFVVMARWRKMVWTREHTLSTLLFTSMFLSPYASQQSVAPALAFIPSWIAVIIQYLGLALGMISYGAHGPIPLYVLFFACVSLILFIPRTENGKARRLTGGHFRKTAFTSDRGQSRTASPARLADQPPGLGSISVLLNGLDDLLIWSPVSPVPPEAEARGTMAMLGIASRRPLGMTGEKLGDKDNQRANGRDLHGCVIILVG